MSIIIKSLIALFIALTIPFLVVCLQWKYNLKNIDMTPIAACIVFILVFLVMHFF